MARHVYITDKFKATYPHVYDVIIGCMASHGSKWRIVDRVTYLAAKKGSCAVALVTTPDMTHEDFWPQKYQ